MRIPINMGVKGRVTATLTNTETGEKQEVKGDNLILNHYLDWAMTQGLGILGTTTFNRCYIGTSDVPPQPTDTTFVGTQLAMSAVSELVKGIGTVRQKFVSLNRIENFEESDMAFTSDGRILLVAANGSVSTVSGLRAFLIDRHSGMLTQLDIPDFEDLENVNCQHLSCNGDYVYVNASGSGKVFRQQGDSFTVEVEGIPSNNIRKASISHDGSHLLLVSSSIYNPPRLYDISTNTPIEINYDSGGFDIFRGASFIGESNNFAAILGFFSGNFNCVFYDVSGGEVTLNQQLVLDTTHAFDIASISNESLGLLVRYGGSIDRRIFLLSKKESVWSLGGISGPLPVKDVERLWSGKDCIVTVGGNVASNKGAPVVIYQQLPRSSRAISIHDLVACKNESVNPGVLEIFGVRSLPRNKQSYSRQWTFPAGVGTGTVNRVGLQANSGTEANGNNRHVAQIVLPEPLEKTDLHQLDVIWEIEVENPGVWEGVIPGGSRDGSDLAWRVTINEEQFYDLVKTGYRITANWFGITGTPNVRIGTSNEESDLILDRDNIRGDEIEYISSTAIRVVNPYVPGSLKRTIRLFLEVNQGNGQIGEMVLGGSTSDNSLARITFDPPLDKPPDVGEGANPYRIYLDLEIGWQRGESNA